jgi:RNA polymerase sigma factor for flagellar operon FliA
MRQRLTEAISDLPERERLITTLYYFEEVSMKEIGLILGVVESRISQLHASAVLHLRARLATSIKKPQNKPDGDRPDRLAHQPDASSRSRVRVPGPWPLPRVDP